MLQFGSGLGSQLILCPSALSIQANGIMRYKSGHHRHRHHHHHHQSSGAVRKSSWTSWAPVPNTPTVSVDVTQHSTIILNIIIIIAIIGSH